MLGGVQPDLIRQVVSQSVDDGLVQRLMPIILRPGFPAVNDPEAARAMRDFDALTSQLLSLRASAAGHLRFDEGRKESRRNSRSSTTTWLRHMRGPTENCRPRSANRTECSGGFA